MPTGPKEKGRIQGHTENQRKKGHFNKIKSLSGHHNMHDSNIRASKYMKQNLIKRKNRYFYSYNWRF